MNMIRKNIRYLRNRGKLTQEELAKLAGISYVTITKIERGVVNNPRVWTLIKIAKALGVSLDNLTADK